MLNDGELLRETNQFLMTVLGLAEQQGSKQTGETGITKDVRT